MMMYQRFALLLLASVLLFACDDDGGTTDTLGGDAGNDASDTTVAPDAVDPDATEPDVETLHFDEQGLGTACACDGDGCEMMGVPLPNGGSPLGCDEMGTTPGAASVCVRGYNGDTGTQTWFANGFCSLMAATCEGDDTVCDSATFGDFDVMTACPEGTVMLVDSNDVNIMDMFSGTVTSKICVPGCEGDDDCRVGEHDPVWDETTQYQCMDNDGVMFCYDPRNLSETYTATQF